MTKALPAGIKAFVDEMSGFAQTAEDTLKKIQEDLDGNKGLFTGFTARMIAIRGTALQLGLPHVADIARLGEELSVKAPSAPSRAHVRKCVGAMWDALSTVKHLLVHYDQETGEEQEILVNRLNKTLESLGGARETVSANEIEELLKAKG